MKSSFCGEIDEIPFISIDNFENRFKTVYFLSHYHSDHFCGLDNIRLPSALEKHKAFIYASEVTIAIIKNDQRSELIPYLKVLELGRNTLTINTDNKETILNVTTLPAGHSLGSVMFLFEYQQTILYTGDFRITPNDITKYTHLHKKNGDPIHIDALYIDTTFQEIPFFPRRSDVVRNVVRKVQDWLGRDKGNMVVLETSANYGYECLCNEIYLETNVKSYVGEHKWNIFSQFPKEIFGITKDPTSRVHLKFKSRVPIQNPKILTIRFSAMCWLNENINEVYIKDEETNYIKVCFSTHCGRDELIHFVNYFRPAKVVGFPNSLIRSSPVKMAEDISPLEVQISKRSKRLQSDDDVATGKKISADLKRRLFDW